MLITGFFCGPRVYEFEGWTFEWHSYCGPWPLKKNGDPRFAAGRRFWQMIKRFDALSPEERVKCRIVDGGCTPLVMPQSVGVPCQIAL